MGRAGFRLNPTASQQGKRLGVEVYIDHPESKRLFQALAAQREQLEQQLGFALDWQELPEAQACRIASWRPNSPLEEEGSWSEYLDWFVERLVKMNTVFRPAIQALP